MTNGEKIQQMFPRKCPHIGFNENFGRIWLMQDGEDFANFTLKWWNAEYKEPITENCIACKYDETEEEDSERCKKCLEGDSQFELDNEFVALTIKNDSSVLAKNSKKLEKDFGESDYISRAEVIDIVENTTEEWLKGDINFMYPSLIKKIKGLPPLAPQEPKTGHWIPRNSFLLQYKCSECGLESEKYNYCPNCGSRNEVEE